MNRPARTFTPAPAKRENCPLLIGIVGASGSGKTYSALRLGTGIANTLGKPLHVIDTEAGRAAHYADRFAFEHVRFDPPFGPLDYRDAIETCIRAGAGCIVVDSMTHEHSGPGGVLEQIEQYLDAKAGDNWAERNKYAMIAHKEPKAQRRKLNDYVVQIGAKCPVIFCYRAHEALDFKTKDATGKPLELGWVAETTSRLMFEMTQQFLLSPGCDGVPTLTSSLPGERKMIKSPVQFREWFRAGESLSESTGERFARWAYGAVIAATGEQRGESIDVIEARILSAPTEELLKELWTATNKKRTTFAPEDYARLNDAKNRRKAELMGDV